MFSNDFIKQIFENIKVVDPTPEEAEEEKKQEDALKEARKQQAFENSGIGERYYGARLNNIDLHNSSIREAKDKIKSFIADVNDGKYRTLWLCGKNGTGKTMLSAIITRECYGHYVKARKLVKEDQDRFTDRISHDDIVRKYAMPRVLVIDEVGKSGSADEAGLLFEIIDERYERKLPTVLVSNLNKKQLWGFLGQSCYERFIESCTAIELNFDSYRMKLREV